jgi:ribonuclease R
VPLVTIDGEDARDFDDAVYCEPAKVGRFKKPNGWRLLVAIADVSHYVKPGEPLDRDAYERATSVYFPRRVIPCCRRSSPTACVRSTRRSTASVHGLRHADQPASGEVHAYQFFPAVISSHARFTYTEVAAILGNTRGPEAAAPRPNCCRTCCTCTRCTELCSSQRALRGAVDFETTETQIVCDDNGRISKIVPRVRTEAHR